MKPLRPLEKTFQAKVVRKLKTLKNCWFYKSSDRLRSGIPDIIASIDGKFVAMELKRDEKSKPTPLQKHTIEKINESHGEAMVVTPENFDDVWEHLQDLAGALK
jgi:hypothetical protein